MNRRTWLLFCFSRSLCLRKLMPNGFWSNLPLPITCLIQCTRLIASVMRRKARVFATLDNEIL